MIIHTFEDGGRTEACKRYLSGAFDRLGINECIILPIPTSRDGVHLTGTDVLVNSLVERVGYGTLTVGYSIPDDAVKRMHERGGIVYDASNDEEFLVGNAELTAISALGVLLTTERRVPKEVSFGVVGYGRIGREITRLLLFLGASVKVFTTRKDVRLLLSEFGVATSESVCGADLSGIDVLINTAPARIFDNGDDPYLKKMRVIDLASGNNFPSLENAESYPSIPAKMYPESSGALLAESAISYVERLLRKQQ